MTHILIYDPNSSDPLWAGQVEHVPRVGERVALWHLSPVVTLLVRDVVLRLPEGEVYVHCVRDEARPLLKGER